MKKLFFTLIAFCTVFTFPLRAEVQKIELYRPGDELRAAAAEMAAGDFLRAVQKGDLAVILAVEDVSLLHATDKFGNNAFHLAKDASTVQALAKVVRRLEPKNSFVTINQLRNQRNQTGETPLMLHINYGKTDTFQLLYEGSDLALAIREANAVNTGGALLHVATIKQGVALGLSKDNSGRTVAQAALANRNLPGMERIVQFFSQQAPYLF